MGRPAKQMLVRPVGARRQWAADRAIRPKYQRHVEAAFWEQIAMGLLPVEAASLTRVAQAVGVRWFHNACGMPPFDLKFQPSGHYLLFAEREEIALLKAQGKGVRDIARTIGRDPGTVSRELRRGNWLFPYEGVLVGSVSLLGWGSGLSDDGGSYAARREDLDVSDAIFACPDLTTFCRLDELGLEVTGQRIEPHRGRCQAV